MNAPAPGANADPLAELRQSLPSARATVEGLLRFIYRREGKDEGNTPAEQLSGPALLGAVEEHLPEHLRAPLRALLDARPPDVVAASAAAAHFAAWFLGSYLEGGLQALATRRDEAAVADYRELYWWLMRSGQLKLLDGKALEWRQRESGLGAGQAAAVQRAFRRRAELLRQALSEVADQATLEPHAAEALEEVRVAACISAREAEQWAVQALPRLRELPAQAPGWLRAAVDELQRLEAERKEEDARRAEEAKRAEAVLLARQPRVVRVDAGEFFMGASPEDGEVDALELPVRPALGLPAFLASPRRRVVISRPFDIWNTPFTHRQFRELMGHSPAGARGNEDLPVASITWFEAVACCNALSLADGLPAAYRIVPSEAQGAPPSVTWRGPEVSGWRLPTEAEWEYACRTGLQELQSVKLLEIAWTRENSGGTPHRVAEKSPDGWGLYDMLGNVPEWCWDWQGEYAPGRFVDPLGPGEGTHRACRGGSWRQPARDARPSARDFQEPSSRGAHAGFRPVRTLLK